MGLYTKIIEVMKKVEYLKKDGLVDFNRTKYNFLSEEKITTEVRSALIEVGLVILPIDSKAEMMKDNLSHVSMKYKIVDVETGEHEILSTEGFGSDTQDKGIAKAQTMAYKYMQRQTFAIPSGDDPDKISSAELDEKQRLADEKKAKQAEADKALYPQVKAKWETLAGNLDGFEDWHSKQISSGSTNGKMNQFLAKKLMDKKKESA